MTTRRFDQKASSCGANIYAINNTASHAVKQTSTAGLFHTYLPPGVQRGITMDGSTIRVCNL